jgi:hypothetical protein
MRRARHGMWLRRGVAAREVLRLLVVVGGGASAS